MAKIITHSIQEYIDKNQSRKQVAWKSIDSMMVFFHKGNWVNQKYFDDIYPEYEYIKFNDKGDNPDKTRII
jgi:hypothetical protein